MKVLSLLLLCYEVGVTLLCLSYHTSFILLIEIFLSFALNDDDAELFLSSQWKHLVHGAFQMAKWNRLLLLIL